MSKIKVTLIKSLSGRLKAHQACAKGLGIKKIHKTVEVNDTPENCSPQSLQQVGTLLLNYVYGKVTK